MSGHTPWGKLRHKKDDCKLCGKPAKGWAEINGRRYCHDDGGVDSIAPDCIPDPPPLTCYERVQYELMRLMGAQLLREHGDLLRNFD